MEGRLGKYEIRKTLGRGAAGTVYEAWDPVIARQVAIKTVKLPEASDEEAQEQLERFRREAQAAGRLTHPNIVGVFDYGETEEIAYIVMEYVDGESLKAVLDRKDVFAIPDIVRVMDELLAGLGFSHDRGVVHRDIKPANLMLTKQGRVKIADFGIARIESSGLTQVGTIMGTPAYMSPEQFTGQVVDARTDLYSAGVVLYQMLTGERPFEGSMTAIMQKALNTAPARPSDIAVTAPLAFDAVVLRAMAKRPEDRFADAGSFNQALHAAMVPQPAPRFDAEATMLQPEPATPRIAPPAQQPVPAARKSGAMVPVLAGVAVLLALLGGGGWFLFGRPSPVSLPQPIKPPVVAQSTPPAAIVQPPSVPPPILAPLPTPPAGTAAGAPAQLNPPALKTVDRRALTAAITALPCALLNGNLPEGGGWLRLTGVIAEGAPRDALDHALAEYSPRMHPEGMVQTFPSTPDYCRMLDILAPVSQRFGDPGLPISLRTLDGRTRLLADEVIKLRVRMSDFAGEMRVDYLASDGNVYHVHPVDGAASRIYPPGQEVTPGLLNGDGKVGDVGEPFGYDMIVAVASSLQLFAKPRPSQEPAATYLKDLQTAIDLLHKRGGHLDAAAIVLQTGPR